MHTGRHWVLTSLTLIRRATIAKEAPQYKRGNYRIISVRTSRRIRHIEDCLEWGKVRFELWDYARKQGAVGHVDAYLGADQARKPATIPPSGRPFSSMFPLKAPFPLPSVPSASGWSRARTSHNRRNSGRA